MRTREAPIVRAGRVPRTDVAQRLLFLAPVLLLVALGWTHRWTEEDAFLNFRIVDQIRAGHGVVFNVGERVEVATSALWLWILVVGRTVLPVVRIEYLAMAGGLIGTGLGLYWVQKAAAIWWCIGVGDDEGETRPVLVPFGAIVVAAVPASWEWATSGLENGLSLAWLGALALILAHLVRDRGSITARRAVLFGAVIGLGPLVRPDLTVMSAVALVAALWAIPVTADRVRVVCACLALPVAYEVFRGAYYGILVPNTALAKAASSIYLGDGVRYLLDFLTPYLLYVPLVAVLAVGVLLVRSRPGPVVVSMLALPVAGIIHVAYITAIGGDYLHARLLLPSLFAILAPFAVIPFRRRVVVPIGVTAVWALVAAFALRPSITQAYAPLTSRGISEGRMFMAHLAKPGHRPLLMTDFRPTDGLLARRLQREGRRALVSIATRQPVMDATPRRTTLISTTSGISGYEAGPDVIVQESLALADAVGSHMPARPHAMTIAGHRKKESWEWMLALRAKPGINLGYNASLIASARHALGCDGLAQLLDSIEAPLGPGRLWSNLVGSIGRTRFVVPRDPRSAEAQFCRR